MKNLLLFLSISLAFMACESGSESSTLLDKEEVLSQYEKAISNINALSYHVQMNDTFVSGEIWNNEADILIERLPSDSVFGYTFWGKRTDIPTEILYDGRVAFDIDLNDSVMEIDTRPGYHIKGHPGGQGVADELMNLPSEYEDYSYSKSDDAHNLTFYFANNEEFNINDRSTTVSLDKMTFLPVKIYSSSVRLDKRQAHEKIISQIVLNDEASVSRLSDKSYLAQFEIQEDKIRVDPVEKLFGKEAYPFQLTSFDEETVSLESLKGKTVLLDFWEVWCGPCIAAMPKVQALQDKYADKDFKVLGIMTEDHSLSSAKKLIAKKGLSFENLIGNEEMKKKYRVFGVPTYVLINDQGVVIFGSTGYSELLESEIEKAIL